MVPPEMGKVPDPGKFILFAYIQVGTHFNKCQVRVVL